MLNHERIAREYPELTDIVYVDGGQMGLPPLCTRQAGREFMDSYLQALLHDGDTGGSIRKKARSQLAQLVGGKPEEIIFTKSTSEGNAFLANGYPLGPGDNVVTSDLEHPCNLYPWIYASQNRGFEVRIVKSKNGQVDTRELLAQVDGHTKVVTLSVVQAGTGCTADLKAIAQACHEKGGILAVDAIQALGRMDIQVDALGIDYLSCGSYKGLLSGFGAGFVWCREALIQKIQPMYISAFSAQSFPVPPDVIADTEGIALRTDLGRLEPSTQNIFGISMLSASTELLLELGMENIQAHILQLEDQLRKALSGLTVVTPEDPACRSGMVVLYYPAERYAAVKQALAEQKILLTHRPGYIRMVLSFHNRPEEMVVIADTLHRALT